MQRLLHTLLRRLAPPDDPSSDAAVLLRFVRHRDETAFELLVWRHGRLVMGVCRRVLRDEHLAEDAFQATFLILARKAGSVRGSLAGWLHQVARRVCLKARKRNPVPMEPGSDRGVFDPDPTLPAELRAVLDEEIARLPEKQRLVVLLCYLQGRTTDDAAKFLGVPQGTVLSRLDAARKRLRAALTRRGVTVPAALFATAISTPDVTAEVCQRATAAALDYLNSAAVISVPSQLAHEVTQMTARKTALGMMAAVVLVSGVGTGVGLVMAQSGKTPPTKAADKPPAEPAKAEQKPSDADLQAKLRDRRLEELQVHQLQITRQIEDREDRRLKLYADSGGEVDPSALQAKITLIDKELLDNEDTMAGRTDEIKQLEKLVGDMTAGKFDKSGSYHKEVASYADTAEVSRARTTLSKRTKELDQMKTKLDPDAPALKVITDAVKVAEEEMKQVYDRARAKAEPQYQEQLKQTTEEQLKKGRDRLTWGKSHMTELRAKRIELVVRIQRSKAALNAQQLIDDEIQVLREIRKQVLRERLLLEMGLDKQK